MAGYYSTYFTATCLLYQEYIRLGFVLYFISPLAHILTVLTILFQQILTSHTILQHVGQFYGLCEAYLHVSHVPGAKYIFPGKFPASDFGAHYHSPVLVPTDLTINDIPYSDPMDLYHIL